MGLDIVAYRDVSLIDTLSDVEEYEAKYPYAVYGESTVYVYRNDPVFAERMADLVPGGVYWFEESFKFRAGSYYGYNRWRDELSRLMLGVPADTVYDNLAQYQDKPFFELIWFSDCEGFIGTEVSRRLEQAFIEHQNKIEAASREWREGYALWWKAFRTAAQNGFVQFR